MSLALVVLFARVSVCARFCIYVSSSRPRGKKHDLKGFCVSGYLYMTSRETNQSTVARQSARNGGALCAYPIIPSESLKDSNAVVGPTFSDYSIVQINPVIKKILAEALVHIIFVLTMMDLFARLTIRDGSALLKAIHYSLGGYRRILGVRANGEADIKSKSDKSTSKTRIDIASSVLKRTGVPQR